MFGLHICMRAICMPGALGSQKKVADPLEWGSQPAVSDHMGIENQTWVL